VGLLPLLADQTSSLTATDELIIVVGGSIIAALVLGGARLAWRWWMRPELEITVGSGPEFEKLLGDTDSFVSAVVGNQEYLGAWAKYVCVRETRGKSRGLSVVARMKDIEPGQPDWPEKELQWAVPGDATQVSIQPGGRQYVRIQVAVMARERTADAVNVYVRCAPPMIEHAPDDVSFTIELLLDGVPHTSARLRMQNVWNGPKLSTFYDADTHAVAAFPYPTLTIVRSH
jgi:hypothetical protein